MPQVGLWPHFFFPSICHENLNSLWQTQSLHLVSLPGFEVAGLLSQALWFSLLFSEAQPELPDELWILHRTAEMDTINVRLAMHWESLTQREAVKEPTFSCSTAFPGHSPDPSSQLFSWQLSRHVGGWGVGGKGIVCGGRGGERCPQTTGNKSLFTNQIMERGNKEGSLHT